jgi:hypothetical protein
MLSLSGGSIRRYAGQVARGQRIAAVLAGILLILAGLHDTLLYWMI